MSLLLTPPSMTEDEVFVKRRKVADDEERKEEAVNQLPVCFAPLSNLPTPPLSGKESPQVSVTEIGLDDEPDMAWRGKDTLGPSL